MLNEQIYEKIKLKEFKILTSGCSLEEPLKMSCGNESL